VNTQVSLALSTLLQAVLPLLLATIVGIGSFYLHKLNTYLSGKAGADNWNFLKSLTGTVVSALEQSPAYQSWDGTKKKEAAMMQIIQLAAKYGIVITSDEISNLVEEAVQLMKVDLGDLAPTLLASPIAATQSTLKA